MPTFKLYKDIKYAAWDRLYYKVEAETKEEAIKKVIDGDVEEYDIEGIGDYETLYPEDNNGEATIEILDEKFNTVYTNID